MFSFPSCICQQVKEVSHFPDIEVQVVESFPDLEVRRSGPWPVSQVYTLEIWHRYHKLKMVVWKMYLLSHYGYFGVSILNILKFRGSESRPTFLIVAGYFEVNNPRCSEGKRAGGHILWTWSRSFIHMSLYTEAMNMHLASGEKGLSFPWSLWRMADGGPFPGLYREIRSKLSWCLLSLPGRSIFSLYVARVVQYLYLYIYICEKILSPLS